MLEIWNAYGLYLWALTTVLVVISLAWLAWQTFAVDIDDPADCLAKFRSNRWVGWLLLAGIVAGRYFA